MEKRALLAVVLSIAVFYAFSLLNPPPPEKKPAVAVDSKQAAPAAPAAAVPQPAVAPAPLAVSADAQKDAVVDTPLFTAVFSARGASLKSLTLKRYRDANTAAARPVVLGSDVDPVLKSFSTRGAGFNLPDSALYGADREALNLNATGKGQLAFTHVSPHGYTVNKVYSFSADSYGIRLETRIFNNSAAPLTGVFQQVMTYPAEPKVKDNRFDTAGPYLFSDNTLHVDKAKDLAGAVKKYEKGVQWAAFADKYFMSGVLADNSSIAAVELKKNSAGYLESIVSSPQFTVNPGASAAVSHRLFVGPKDIDILKAQGNSLEQSLDLGWFTAIAKPMLYTLKFFHGVVGNYGLAIIIITVILKMLFFPLTHKSYKSMKDMQKIQPEMNRIREKFKNDRDAMNKAVMELYRDHKVNPLGGCLPMVVQIPVFFALYKALMFSIELRHAPFFLWITDLSDKDPYYVTPIVMGVTMFIQQKMTPSQMDPMQQKIMLMLPVVFTFMFLSFPSGLVMYWLVNNVLTIGQQMYINKLVKD